ncbi:ComGF family competence protein [bacterium LRH843]|nr:ComGF family competence protein [bacterium LRH843]
MNTAYWHRNERGFTLIEMLLVLSILLLLVSFFPAFMKIIVTGHELENDSDIMVFFNHLARDVREAKVVETGNRMILVRMSEKERYLTELIPSTNQIRRLRNGVGHVLLLERVKSFQCHSSGQIVHCGVEMLNGKKQSRSMIVLHPS